MKYIFTLIIFICSIAKAQDRFLTVSINNTQFYAGDTIQINTDYVDDYNAKKDGTLYVKLVNEKGAMWNYRWPIYAGICSPKIVVPATISNGIYHLYFATRDERFNVKGILVNNLKNDRLDATLINKENLVVTKDIPINYDNSFNYTNPYFRNEAILHFKNTKDKGRKPNIKINAVLDSSFTPTATKYIMVKMGRSENITPSNTMPKRFDEVDVFFGKKIKVEEMVTVKANYKTQAKSFEKENVGEAFKDRGEKTLNLFEDDPGLYGQTLFMYLQNNIPNLNLVRNDSNSEVAFELRGNPMVFYLDQVPLPSEFVMNIDLNDIAIIKVFNPPFPMNIDANTGAIALFTKKNKNSANGKNSFLVKGYSSPIEVMEGKN